MAEAEAEAEVEAEAEAKAAPSAVRCAAVRGQHMRDETCEQSGTNKEL